jgi:hypothetical protein
LIDKDNIKNTIAANAARYDNERYCYEDSYSERRITLLTEGLEPRYANALGNISKENTLVIVDFILNIKIQITMEAY